MSMMSLNIAKQTCLLLCLLTVIGVNGKEKSKMRDRGSISALLPKQLLTDGL